MSSIASYTFPIDIRLLRAVTDMNSTCKIALRRPSGDELIIHHRDSQSLVFTFALLTDQGLSGVDITVSKEALSEYLARDTIAPFILCYSKEDRFGGVVHKKFQLSYSWGDWYIGLKVVIVPPPSRDQFTRDLNAPM